MPEPIKKVGRPIKLKQCIVCGAEKKTNEFPNPGTAKMAGRCIMCGREARGTSEEREAKKLVKKVEAREAARVQRFIESPNALRFKNNMEIAERNDIAVAQIGEVLKRMGGLPFCGCCFEQSTGQDTVGFKYWCTLCGWGIERTGRCLAHPGRLHYPELPQDAVLPPELLAMIRHPRAPALLHEAEPSEPDWAAEPEPESSTEPPSAEPPPTEPPIK